jgi:hypothetical protein
MGLVSLRRTDRAEPTVVLEDVRQAVDQPVGGQVRRWLVTQDRLARMSDNDLLGATLSCEVGLVRTVDELMGPDGWQRARQVLRQSSGMRWELELDDPIAALVAGCAGHTSLRVVLGLIAGSVGAPFEDVAAAALPVVRDLVTRGFLLLPGTARAL